MQSFQHIAPPVRLFCGEDSLNRLGPELDRLHCKRVVIFCGASLRRQDVLLDRLSAALGDRFAGVFSEVHAHSPVPAVMAGADELARIEADAVIAVGGGSAIVTARAASILMAEGMDVRKLCTAPDGKGGLTSPRLLNPKLPQFVVPTTPTTAVVKAGSAVFDPATGERLALFDPKTRAQAIFLDPKMLGSAPPGLVASAALNAFATAIEGLMSPRGNPLSDALLMHAVRLLQRNLAALPGDDSTRRGELALGAALCGQGTDHTGAGITTVLGHAIGARHEIDNGIVNAVVMPHVLRFNAEAAASGLMKVAAALGLPNQDAHAALDAILKQIQTLFDALDTPKRLRELGIPAEVLSEIAIAGMQDWFLGGNPRRVSNAGELQTILEQAW